MSTKRRAAKAAVVADEPPLRPHIYVVPKPEALETLAKRIVPPDHALIALALVRHPATDDDGEFIVVQALLHQYGTKTDVWSGRNIRIPTAHLKTWIHCAPQPSLDSDFAL